MALTQGFEGLYEWADVELDLLEELAQELSLLDQSLGERIDIGAVLEDLYQEVDTYLAAPGTQNTGDLATALQNFFDTTAAFNGSTSILRVLDENMNVLGSVLTSGGNSIRTYSVKLENVIGTVFHVDEFDTSTDWRYRSHIVFNGATALGNAYDGVRIFGINRGEVGRGHEPRQLYGILQRRADRTYERRRYPDRQL